MLSTFKLPEPLVFLLVLGGLFSYPSFAQTQAESAVSNIPMNAPDVPMAAPDVPMQGAPDAPTSKMIIVSEPPVVQGVPMNEAAATEDPKLEPPVVLDEPRKVINSGKMIQILELPPTEATGDDVAGEAGDAPILPDPNAPALPADMPEETFKRVSLFGINKIAARSEDFSGNVGDVMRFKNLEIIAFKCQAVLDNGKKGFAALLQIMEMKVGDNPRKIFQGWMFSSSPSLNSLQHPLYDIGVKSCTNANSETGKKTEEKAKPEVKAVPKK